MLHTTSNLYWFSFFFHSYQSFERTNDSCTWSSMKDYMLDQFILWRLLILFLVRRLPPKWFNHIVFLPCRYAYLETQSLTLSWMKIFISIKRKNRFSFLIKHFIFPVTIKRDLAIILAQLLQFLKRYSVEKTISFRRILQAPDKYNSLSGDTFYEWVSA